MSLTSSAVVRAVRRMREEGAEPACIVVHDDVDALVVPLGLAIPVLVREDCPPGEAHVLSELPKELQP